MSRLLVGVAIVFVAMVTIGWMLLGDEFGRGLATQHGGVAKLISRTNVLVFGVTVFALVVLVGIVRRVRSHLRHRPREDARWASTSDIRRSGLFAERGIIVGRWGSGKRILRVGGETHVLLAAPTRSGKGVGFVIPNLLDWPGSVVVLDIKGENYRHTAGFRASFGHQVFRFDPDALQTDRWNPLAYVARDSKSRPRDLHRLAASLFPTVGGAEEFWVQQARELFIGAAMLVLEANPDSATMGEVHRLLSAPDLATVVRDDLLHPENGDSGVSAECLRRLSAWANCDAEATRAGVLASAQEKLLPWGEPILDAATMANDFDFRNLRTQGMAVYVVVNPASLARLSGVLRLFFEQLVHANTDAEFGTESGCTVPTLLMLDEFPALGRVGTIEHAIAYLAGYGIRICLVAQSEAQLRSVYGTEGARVLTDNCSTRVHYAPNQAREAQAVSEALGVRTVGQRTRSRGHGWFGRASVSIAESARPLMLPHQVQGIGDREIVLTAGCRPILAQKICWFRDADFRKRAIAAPSRSHT